MPTPASSAPAAAKPWEHAKSGEGSASDPLAARFVESLSYDTRLYDADIRGSLAHAAMLTSVGLITPDDLAAIRRGLAEIKTEIEAAPAGPRVVGVAGAWPGWKTDLEDVHMCIEAALIAKVGDPGRRLHTGRSRNDQVALDLRLWLRDASTEVRDAIDGVLDAFRSLAARQGDVVLPGYTHVQRAQPICVGAEALAWHAMLRRDRALLDGLAHADHECPLGSGALAGSLLPLDRRETAAALGFDGPSPSSIDSTASRDEALDFLYALARLAMHLSRWAEQWILYCTTEFGFLTLGEQHTTGSSMMPQKRNPDMLELIRGRCGGVYGHLVSLLAICKGLPLGYNRDLQEDKRHVFAAFDATIDCVRMTAGIVAAARFNPDRIAASGGGLERGYLDATALAEHLVVKGVPFRTAHQVVGAAVRLCDADGSAALARLSVADFNRILKESGSAVTLDDGVYASLGAANVVARYRSFGHAGIGEGGYRSALGIAASAPPEPPKAGPPTARPDPAAEREPSALFGDLSPRSTAKPAATDTLVTAYLAANRTLDDLPYTPEFDALFERMDPELRATGKAALLHRLHNLRKAGKLPKTGRAASAPPRITPEEESWLGDRVVREIGSLGQRDGLPYTAAFERLVSEFNAHVGRAMDPHDVWRLVAKLAK